MISRQSLWWKFLFIECCYDVTCQQLGTSHDATPFLQDHLSLFTNEKLETALASSWLIYNGNITSVYFCTDKKQENIPGEH